MNGAVEDLAAALREASLVTLTRLGAGDNLRVVAISPDQREALLQVLATLRTWADLKEKIMVGGEEIGDFYRTAWNGIDDIAPPRPSHG